MLENSPPIVCFGEVLWDILPTGPRPGGAPMNVAYHLHKQGKSTALITRIGSDEKGKELRAIFSERGIRTDFFQVDHQNETGKVFAQPNEQNEVVYDIVYPAAWDFIELEDEGKKLVKQSKYFVYGSLIARNKISKDTLYELLEIANNRVLDINLRSPHYNKDTVSHLLTKAHTAKLNIAELELITSWYGSTKTTAERIQLLQDEFNIETIIVTRGAEGAVVNFKGQLFEHSGFKVSVEDTIGSGDAFLAAFLSSLTTNNNINEALFYASRLGAFVATQSGACPDYFLKDVEKFFDISFESISKI
jgi:fructokinase